ncbi:MAG TPA: cytochrome c oxidase assembly protein [Terracidiphilus sp.]|nr:cytochrome c oxidase assembly protein [Terracidiphilus sp.]
MSPAFQSVLDDWSPPVWLTSAIFLAALIYLRGWFAIRKTRPEQFSVWRLTAFMSALACLWIAIGSPLDAFADILLSAHMVEHLILMSLVPPLMLIGLPVVPMLRGLPLSIRKHIAGPLIRLRPLRGLVHCVTRPVVAWLSMNLAFLLWHIPSAYDFALEHEGWHDVEHLCFLSTSLLFWWCVLRPWPAGQHSHDWTILLYLVSADMVNTALSAFLAFCNRPVYPFYVHHPNPFQIAPLPDQVLGAVIMWVIGSLAFLIPAAAITFGFLQPTVNRTAYTRA